MQAQAAVQEQLELDFVFQTMNVLRSPIVVNSRNELIPS
jgi:hypothetical protein